ncbi:MAG: CpsB/CapC family capsule biosynthesis tyrosine phosphatase, partial [Clostridiales bacterium]
MSRIDFHAHILPRVDHGSDSLSTSLFQLAQAAAVGINTIVATPHFYPDRHHPSDFLLCRQKAFQELRQAYHGDITILPAAEVLLCEGL